MNPSSEHLKEQRDHGTSVFPCGLYEVFEDTVWSGAKHHWHDEVEIIYFMKGDYKVNVNMESYSINRECFFFINSGDLHSIEPLSKSVESAIVFNPCILSFEHYDIAQTRLLHPLVNKEIHFPHMLSVSHPAFSRIKQEYLEIINAFHQTGFFLAKDIQMVTENPEIGRAHV